MDSYLDDEPFSYDANLRDDFDEAFYNIDELRSEYDSRCEWSSSDENGYGSCEQEGDPGSCGDSRSDCDDGWHDSGDGGDDGEDGSEDGQGDSEDGQDEEEAESAAAARANFLVNSYLRAESAAAAQVDSFADTYLEAVDSAPDDSMAVALAGAQSYDAEVLNEDRLKAVKELHALLQIPYKPQRSWGSILLDCIEEDLDQHLRQEIEEFSGRARLEKDTIPNYKSCECPDEFLNRSSHLGWASHDRAVDVVWDAFVRRITELADKSDAATLSKPSGPMKAALTCVWAYPTFSTNKKRYLSAPPLMYFLAVFRAAENGGFAPAKNGSAESQTATHALWLEWDTTI